MTEAAKTTAVRYVSGKSSDPNRPWFARFYYAENTTKGPRKLPVGGQLAIATTNSTRVGLQADIDVAAKRADIGFIEWGGPS